MAGSPPSRRLDTAANLHSPRKSEQRSPLFLLFSTPATKAVAFGFTLTVIFFTLLLAVAITPSASSSGSSAWLRSILRTSSSPSSHFLLLPTSPHSVYSPLPPPLPPHYLNASPTSSSFIRSKKRKRRTGATKRKRKSCDLYDGRWVRDNSYYPLYTPGSCPHIDEPFNCHLNGRPDSDFLWYRWLPRNCNIPRLNGKRMLNMLRGKRLVFVGDSLNRNMWESLVCILRNSVADKSKVFEASGKEEFRAEGSYSFIFADYNCSVEFFRTPFLVREWEITERNGSKKETLRLDLVDGSSDNYKNADVLIFNTGHWWTHEKTLMGKAYYQEGDRVYSELSAQRAFWKAMSTWARWIDSSVDPTRTLVFFRGYSSSHFFGGQWNSGGECDKETKPILDQVELTFYPRKMRILESVMKRMKTPVIFLNITKMSDFRKDAHPSIYSEQNSTEERRRSPSIPQDCSHWCLPGVPDTWNELLYYHLLVRHYGNRHKRQRRGKLRTRR